MSVAGQLLILQLVVFTVVAIVAGALIVVDERGDADEATRRTVTDIAVTAALFPEVSDGLVAPDPTAALQPRAEQIREATGVDFVVVVDPEGIRVTHPVPEQIGLPYTGHTDEARSGTPFTETYTGSLGPSIRTIAPVYDDGTLVGFVSVGVTRERIAENFVRSLPGILGLVAAGLVVTAAGGYLISRRLRRQTLGLNPDQLRRMYEHHDAVLHSIGEGLLVFGTADGSPRVDIVNDEARRLLGLEPVGAVEFDGLPATVRELAVADEARDEVHLTRDRVLVVNSDAVLWKRRRIGTVVTLRDHTELRGVLGELDSVRGFAESLRAQAHESANRLHTIITMVELGRPEEAVAFATQELAVSQHLIDRLTGAVHEPALSALLLGKIDEAAERGVELTVTDDTELGPVPIPARDIVTLVGNLIDNAIDASHASDDPWVEVTVRQEDSSMIVEVADSGPGMSPEVLARAMQRGYSTKSEQRGLGLALVAQVVARHGGTLRTEPSLGSMIVAEIPLGGAS
ncbi:MULTISPECIES: sensor histidine kinase [unclassified Rhodococcus (in: high G+C Gram-positive bacteria)]|uniref:sensor histidine kinase n=1 Tax=unclassified Rhodococcus (in: high G+C Gram-positive bacteria) TaxID=192944 RepID=UPI00233ED328|nr:MULTISPECIES: sensor histidine kinase [unclassified Rhodococcus (in: high G+C Gram-positive bacteria)]MDC3725711.1 sensor histidine kinase [Rhodococcus sp. Rp3]WSE23401.1 sensor histidine kinase [Rhodococcus sp. PD04]